MLGKSQYFFVVLWHERSCQEMRGTILWLGNQDNSTTLQSINFMHWRPSFQRRTMEIRWRMFNSMLSNCSDMFILGTYWTTRYLMVSEKTCKIQSQNGPKFVANNYLVWSLTFTRHVTTNKIVMWVILPNKADWDCFQTPILQEILRIQNLHQEEHCAFLEVIRFFQMVGCVRNKLQFRAVQQNQKSILWTQDWGWTGFPLSICGIWSSHSSQKHASEWSSTGKLVYISNAKDNSWKDLRSEQCWIYFIEPELFSWGSFVVYLWRQRSSDQEDHKGKKSFNETCFQNPQSCSWLVVW